MARIIKNAKLDTRSSRTKLRERREPYWAIISSGCQLGYRRGAKGGTWIAKLRIDDGKRYYESLGAADDIRDADGLTVFSFVQAQEKARQFFKRKAKELSGDYTSDGPYTVELALEDYFRKRERSGSKGVSKDKSAANKRILAKLGNLKVSKLTTRRVRDWHQDLAEAPKEVRASKSNTKQTCRPIDKKNADAVRARRATANRTLTVLKAALNHAYAEERAPANEAWSKVKPFPKVDSAIVRFLTADEIYRLVNACDGAFKSLVQAALVSGCRYGELTRMQARDYNEESGTITVQESKSGKPRHVALTDEGKELFRQSTAGQGGKDLIFLRDDKNPWGASHQQRPLEIASERARIEPATTFHILRHTYASMLAMKGVPMGVIAAQLGHSDTRMTEKHYAHLAPSYIADTVRAALPAMGIVKPANVSLLRREKS